MKKTILVGLAFALGAFAGEQVFRAVRAIVVPDGVALITSNLREPFLVAICSSLLAGTLFAVVTGAVVWFPRIRFARKIALAGCLVVGSASLTGAYHFASVRMMIAASDKFGMTTAVTIQGSGVMQILASAIFGGIVALAIQWSESRRTRGQSVVSNNGVKTQCLT